MNYDFTNYSALSIQALTFNPNQDEILKKKKQIVDSIINHYTVPPASVLFYGFSPLIFGFSNCQINVSGINEQTKQYLDNSNINYTIIPEKDLSKYQKKFSWVIATDEYFTFAASEVEQKYKLEIACSLAKHLVVTTLKDYKNQEYNEKEFSHPIVIHNNNEDLIFLEHHKYASYLNKGSWETRVHEILNSTHQVHGPFIRTSMYFKQMAKISYEFSATNFVVHKNIMYKSLIKKNYEHVISIRF